MNVVSFMEIEENEKDLIIPFALDAEEGYFKSLRDLEKIKLHTLLVFLALLSFVIPVT